MSDAFLSVDQVAEHLGLHVRTIRNYVREGRLPAVRIGKQYRIAREDLETFTGRAVPEPLRDSVVRRRHAEVSSIVEVDAVDRATADRVSTLLLGAAGTGRPGDSPLRVQTVYDEERARMKIVVIGAVTDTARLLDYVDGILST
ncbi:helix-turn-helix domain-containing protein [Rhodococcus triatomae]|uniref:DNA binding domain-containing protein, excisionase family n=1 Tax=Rhodococcus triatomae TaxID=300028 RepID=A0A1G8NZQ9_9NOCA|nr:helix-turn-helix domain-containing protein [Rhodococcus triatomae]QNG18788.1 helix-turn-helix domain-containing protein [Rhodococcus triatomae]QNG25301.1 helix-turn-helix domain-containing protein [Rhodococcus triatomae]SDI85734.1 DNA binding domain-containing protein, excisionase family [Rhodococcus triatomae]